MKYTVLMDRMRQQNNELMTHTVEKIGGTSMSRHQDVLKNIWLRADDNGSIYNRIFVVSAYGGITDELLEHKKSGRPGIYGLFASAEEGNAWRDQIEVVREKLAEINANMFADEALREQADSFINTRLDDAREVLGNLEQVCDFGHFNLSEQLLQVREMLSAIGEAHSAHNSVLLLKQHGVNAQFVDLTNWRADHQPSFAGHIADKLNGIDLTNTMPIVTGYTQCCEGLMRTFDRGYSEMTFSKIATVTGASEAIIHKEFHLSSADPRLVGEDNVRPIGQTNYDVADQLANLGMEAIHPRAGAGLRKADIILRIKNTFEPEHEGTYIRADHDPEKAQVDIIAGSQNVWAVEVFDQDMVGKTNYSQRMVNCMFAAKIRLLAQDFNANTVTFYVKADKKRILKLVEEIQNGYADADIRLEKIAMVSVIGANLNIADLLHNASGALYEAGIPVLATHQAMRQVDLMFMVADEDYEGTVKALHRKLIEQAA
ncbi:aspartate kinase [Suttonella sp. R2A3]|uniref:aspartate kinase n=1 Tax=Suttonella sp. R2A3 TaxID=2908648 RepID=UPI001F491D33|nr:aspartate kinase [Suttonella sp. R2A3]UJF24504.1 aspartate kinase [Suttonella sp. R2A3]